MPGLVIKNCMSRVARIVPGELFAQFLQLFLILREPFLLSISGLFLLLLLLCSGSRLAVPYLRADAGPMSSASKPAISDCRERGLLNVKMIYA